MQASKGQQLRWHGRWLAAIVCAASIGLPLHAAEVMPASTVGPPARVARVSWQAGAVSVLPAGAGQWQAVDLNRPLQGGDRIATDADARVELQLGDAVAHLAGSTDFGFLELGQWQTQLALTQGTVGLDVQALPDGQDVEIDTPQVAVVIDRSARVRVDAGNGGASTVTVRRGSVVVHGKDGALRVLDAGQRVRFFSPVLDDSEALTFTSGDAFDQWCLARDQWIASAENGQYASADMVGYQDLDHYGQWQQEDGYGEVWFPDDVAADWVPYRQGRWAWIAPWGWTWMSDEPWGFAPFHYGRWAVIGGRWGWWPGAVGVRAVYAPALVAFVGGDGWRVSVGFTVGGGPVGWYPLGPGMIFNPWYAAGWSYYERVNCCYRHHRWHGRHGQWREHVRAAYNVWRKPQRLRHIHYLGKPPIGITAMSAKAMAHGRSVATSRLQLASSHWRRAPMRYHGAAIAPRATHAAVWHPTWRTRAPQVVAMHLPAPRGAAGRSDAMHVRHASHVARVHLLASDASAHRYPTFRPLPRRVFDDSSAPRPFARGAGHAMSIHAKPHAATPSKPERRHAPTVPATLPRVQRLQTYAPVRAYPVPRRTWPSLPQVTRLHAAQAKTPASRHSVFSVPAPRQVWRPTPASRPEYRPQFRPVPRSPTWSRSATTPRPYRPAIQASDRAMSSHPAPRVRSHHAASSHHESSGHGRVPPKRWHPRKH